LKNIHNLLITWYLKNLRALPWRETTNPYKIWLSEIILQQTRVDQGLPYYHRFIGQYPTISDLANAPDDEVMKLWQGLGYYSRAKNLLHTARIIATEYHGVFPTTFELIKQMKGIGDYTAAAIASFAFNVKQPVLDGNVYRFITRLYGIETPIDKKETRKAVMEVLLHLMDETQKPAVLNQALMEFGALQCTPKKPKCEACPFVQDCFAIKENKVGILPMKGKPIKIRDRYLNYFVFITPDHRTYIKKRIEKDVWLNLYDFPLIETLTNQTMKELTLHPDFKTWTKSSKVKAIEVCPLVLHKLSHQNLFVTFIVLQIDKPLKLKNSPIFEIEKNIINSFAVPKVIENFLHRIR